MKRSVFLPIIAALALLAPAGSAEAGKLYQLELTYKGPAPTLPADIDLNIYKNEVGGDLKGSSSEIFNGNGDIPQGTYSSDAVAALTDTRIVGNELCITFLVNGWDGKGKFQANTAFELVVNGQSTHVAFHTSCSQPIPFDPVPGVNTGTFQVIAGAGVCVPNGPDCPIDPPKIYSVEGEFRIPPGCAPTGVTLRVYKDTSSLQGTATATFDGVSLSDIVCDEVACLLGGEVDAQTGELVFSFEVLGWKNDGTFDKNTSFELDLGPCGSFQTDAIHTSCSRAVALGIPGFPAGGGTMTLTGGCGVCLVREPISIEQSTWGTVKGLYRDE